MLACQIKSLSLWGIAFNNLLSGDGAGVGKGRQLAGIFLDNWERGRCDNVD